MHWQGFCPSGDSNASDAKGAEQQRACKEAEWPRDALAKGRPGDENAVFPGGSQHCLIRRKYRDLRGPSHLSYHSTFSQPVPNTHGVPDSARLCQTVEVNSDKPDTVLAFMGIPKLSPRQTQMIAQFLTNQLLPEFLSHPTLRSLSSTA